MMKIFKLYIAASELPKKSSPGSLLFRMVHKDIVDVIDNDCLLYELKTFNRVSD